MERGYKLPPTAEYVNDIVLAVKKKYPNMVGYFSVNFKYDIETKCLNVYYTNTSGEVRVTSFSEPFLRVDISVDRKAMIIAGDVQYDSGSEMQYVLTSKMS
jgi:hypothetical protein